ncbi:hypothetical protein CRE_19266 [Caenorhabditis remanei]|uniref:Uncharacterized protein n=2 Tax=Caenorhabditis remanei TaxID=31234 RepID=E3MJS1_CAERE|nr:hypothetical protein CRE_19266 [Caenorhabditis remanei]
MRSRSTGRRGTEYRIAANSPHGYLSGPASSQNIRGGVGDATVSNQSHAFKINGKFECCQCGFDCRESSSVAEVWLTSQFDKSAQFYGTFNVHA